jgi:uncharacterized membrane protein YhaH (DUF805 family)
MTDVFISYKRRLRPRVETLARALRSLKLDVWFDASLEAGSSFSAEISREVRGAKCVLVCWSNDAFPHGGDENGWVLGEAQIGRKRNVLVPVLIEPTELDPPWNTIHTEDLIGWRPGEAGAATDAWRSVLKTIGRYVGRPGLADYDVALAAGTPEALSSWAVAYPSDPLAAALQRSQEAVAPTQEPPPPPAKREAVVVKQSVGIVAPAVVDEGRQKPVAPPRKDRPSPARPVPRIPAAPVSRLKRAEAIVLGLDGRLSRQPFWIVSAILVAIAIGLNFALPWLLGSTTSSDVQALIASGGTMDQLSSMLMEVSRHAGWTGVVIYIVLFYPFAAIGIRRRHDCNSSGVDIWIYMVLTLVFILTQALGFGLTVTDVSGLALPTPPLVVTILSIAVLIYAVYLLVVLGLLKGTPGPNSYGPDPLQR